MCCSLGIITMQLLEPEQVSKDDFLLPNDHNFQSLNIPKNSLNLDYTSPLPKNVIIYCRPQFLPLGGAIIKDSAYPNPYILCCKFKTLISTCSLNCAESRDLGHARFCSPFVFVFSQICKMSQTYFFELLPGDFTDLHDTLYTATMDSPDNNFQVQFAIYFKLLKHVEGLVLNTSMRHTQTAACSDAPGLQGPVHHCLQL